MSHFVTTVLVPPGTMDVQAYIEGVLAPYYEGLEVPEYDRRCYCIGRVARSEAREAASTVHGNIDAHRTAYAELIRREVEKRLPGREEPAWDDKSAGAKEWRRAEREARNANSWENFLTHYIATEKAVFEAHPMKDAPEPTCGFYSGPRKDWWPTTAKEGDRFEDGSGCGATGTYKSTYNPRSKWDWYVIGGRWAGWITQRGPAADEDAHVYGSKAYEFARAANKSVGLNSLAADLYLKDIDAYLAVAKLGRKKKDFSAPSFDEDEEKTHNPIPYALVDLAGEWHAKAEMGWWGMSRNVEAEHDWAHKVREIVASAPAGTLVVACDLHI